MNDEGLKTDFVAPKVTMVVPCWNQLEFTKRLVESIRRYVQIPHKIVFVNNGSEDGTREYLDALAAANPRKVEVIHNKVNLGFVTAMNQGFERCEGHFLWLNNDVEFLRPGTLEMLVDNLESNPQIGAIGPVSDGVMGPQIIYQGIKYPEFHKARFLIGFFLLVREDVWRKVGPLDPQFNNLGNDDLDYSIRIRKEGYSLGILRTAFVHHAAGTSWNAMFPGGYASDAFRQMDNHGRNLLTQKWGKDVVEELFLPVDFSGARILFAVPVWGEVLPEAYSNHMGTMLQEIRQSQVSGLEIEFAPMLRSAIVCARNELVRVAIKRDCTHLFFLDDDMLMPPGAIHRMLNRNKDIVSGLCHLRTPPHFPSMFIDPDHKDGKIFYVKDWPPDSMIKVDAVGSACVMIKTEVFEKIRDTEYPDVKKAGEELWYLYGKARPGEHTVGEDVFFCKLARAAGYEIWVDTSLQFGHVGPPLIYSTEYFSQVRGQNIDAFPGIVYTDYDAARAALAEPNGKLSPEDLANRMARGNAEQGAAFERLYAGQVGDGKHPGNRSSLGDISPKEHVVRGPGGVV